MRFFLITIVIIFIGCSTQNIEKQEVKLTSNTWHQDSVLCFDVEIKHSNTAYNLWLTVENCPQYNYSNLWLFLKSSFANGENRYDTVEYILADDAGRWYGRKVGENWKHRLPIFQNAGFENTGIYRIEIEQGMRNSEIPVASVGIELELKPQK